MKILIVGDIHWCSQSSIIRASGNRYSQRLENLIRSVNWTEQLAESEGCEYIIQLGDWFDKPILDSEELSALQELKWSNIPHFVLVGNHEIGRHDRSLSSAHLFQSFPNTEVLDDIKEFHFANKTALFIPYYLETERPKLDTDYDYIFSHNDIAGVQMGRFISEVGFNQDSINNHCRSYFFNGHLHNGTFVGQKIINVGNLTGQNFGEDALTYSHVVVVLDTVTNEIRFFENPNAFNFYKLGVIDSASDLPEFKNNAVVSVSTYVNNNDVIEALENNKNIVAKRVTFIDTTNTAEDIEVFAEIDYLSQFAEFVKENMEMSDIVKLELAKVIS